MSLLKGESESSMLKEILGNIEFLDGKTDGCRLRVAGSESQMTTVSEKNEFGLKTVDRLPSTDSTRKDFSKTDF